MSDELQGFDGVDDSPTYGLSDECTSMDRHFDVEVWCCVKRALGFMLYLLVM